jgi:hypothetical protein
VVFLWSSALNVFLKQIAARGFLYLSFRVPAANTGTLAPTAHGKTLFAALTSRSPDQNPVTGLLPVAAEAMIAALA